MENDPPPPPLPSILPPLPADTALDKLRDGDWTNGCSIPYLHRIVSGADGGVLENTF